MPRNILRKHHLVVNHIGYSIIVAILTLISGCAAPTHKNWTLVFVDNEGNEIQANVGTAALFRGSSSPKIVKLPHHESAENRVLKNIGSVHQGNQLVRFDGSDCEVGPGCSGCFTMREKETNKVIYRAYAGNSYSSLWGVSPDGDYLAYFVPGPFWRRSYIHHFATGRRAVIHIDERWKLKEWRNSCSEPVQ